MVLWKNNEESPPTFLEKNFNNQGVNFFATTGERFLVSALEAANLAYRPDSHFRWQLTSLDIAKSDDFESRIDMGAAETWETESTNTGATAEPGEPHHAGNTPNQSIWYSWTAPNNGNYLLNTTGANFAPSLAVYAGSNLESLTPVAQGTYRVVFEASAATTYAIALDSSGDQSGAVQLTLEPAELPSNDHFNNRIILPGTRPVFTEFLRYATTEPGESGINGSVWYEWTPDSLNEISYYESFAISLFQSEVENPQLADLVPVSPGFNRPARINTNPNDTYFIRLNQRGSSSLAPFFYDTRLSDWNRRRIITPNASFEERKTLPPCKPTGRWT